MIGLLRRATDEAYIRRSRSKAALVLGTTMAYVLSFPLLDPFLNNSVGILSVVPVVTGAWLLGLRAGLVLAALMFPLNSLMVVLVLDRPWHEWLVDGGILGGGALVLVGAAVGGMRDLRHRAKRELAQWKLWEQGLKKSEERYRRLVDLSPEAMFVTVGGKFAYVNQASLELYGASSAEDLLGRDSVDFVHPDDREMVADRVRRVSQGERLPFRETSIVRLDGAARDVSGSGVTIVYSGQQAMQIVLRDVTRRKQAEQALQENEERFRNLYESAPIAYFSVSMDGCVRMVNKSAEKMLGYSHGDLVGRSVIDLYADTPLGKEKARRLNERIREGEQIYSEELEMRDSSGGSVWIDLTVVLVRDSQGRPIERRAMAVDVTKRKQAEAAVRKAGEELEIRVEDRTAELRALARRLVSVREEERTHIAREIHDELGQGLTSLKLDLSWLKRRLTVIGDDHERSAVLSKIVSIEGTVDSTIASVREISTQLRPTVLDDVGLMAALEWQAMDFQLRTGIACDATLPETEEILGRDQTTALFRICQESLTNVARHAQATRVNLSLRHADGDAVLTVTDDGRGISYGEKVNGRSLGILGMRERALALRGTVHVAGTPGQGTAVTARIPLVEPTSVGDRDKTEAARP